MDFESLLQSKRDEIMKIADKYGARKVRIFGSVARGQAGPDSDIDFLANWIVAVRCSTMRA